MTARHRLARVRLSAVRPCRVAVAWGRAGTRSPLRNGSMVTPSAPIGASVASALNCSRSSCNRSRMAPFALVRFIVQINGNQPPLDEQKVATDGCGLIRGWSAKAYNVPEVPRLMVIAPELIFPVPIAPIMLSPPPLDTMACGFKPRRFASSGRSGPIGLSDSINSGSAASMRPPGSICRKILKSHFRVRTLK